MKKTDKFGLVFALFLVLSLGTQAKTYEGPEQPNNAKEIYPAAKWESMEDLKANGWSKKKLREATNYARSKNTAAYVVIHKGQVVQSYGQVYKKYKLHSVRKSLLSALYGIYEDEGVIDLDATMASLGIDDKESLTETEKQATIHMLLKARSGIYHPAVYETKAMAASRPKRHSHAPGTFYYYNNWDFNALGTIFEQLTKQTVFNAFYERIAKPIGMEDFNPETDGEFFYGPQSNHPAYLFEMTAMDLARFGLLFARGGKWENTQIIPKEWVEASVVPYSNAKGKGGYGYLWWVAVDGKHFEGNYAAPDGLFTARGNGGHVIAVIPELDFVLVHRADTYVSDKRVSYTEVGYLLQHVLNAYEGE